MGKGGKAANDTKPIKRNCIMQSGERAVLVPASFCYSIGLDENLRAVDVDSIIH
jgi:hypothetical protein